MPTVQTGPATYEDLLKVPDHLVAELVEGELYTSPRPSGPHSRAMGATFGTLEPAYDRGRGGPGGWWIVGEPEIHIGRDVLVPDIAGWRRERVPQFLRGPAWEVAPDWVCEVLSPSTARVDRVVKLPKYGQHDVAWAWLIDPVLQTLEIFRLQDSQWLLAAMHAGDGVIRPEPFDTVDFPLGDLWLTPPSA